MTSETVLRLRSQLEARELQINKLTHDWHHVAEELAYARRILSTLLTSVDRADCDREAYDAAVAYLR